MLSQISGPAAGGNDGFGHAILGCGWVARAHAWGVRALREEGVRLVAVADQELARARALAEAFDVPHAYGDFGQVLDRGDVDAVSVCLPDFLHAEATLAAAGAGKHVLCEKPLALDLAEAERMLAACGAARVELGLVMNHRYAPDNIRARAAVRGGALGKVLTGNVVHSSSLTGDPAGTSPWRGRRGRAAGGVLSTQAIHFLDLLLWFAGRASSVSAYADTLVRQGQDLEDTAALAMRMESGALATLVTTSGSPIADDFTGTRIEIQGSEGYLVLEGDRMRTCQLAPGRALPAVSLPPVPAGADEILFGPGHVYELIDFVRAVRRGSRTPVPGADGRHLAAVLGAAYRSAAEARVVSLTEPHDAYSAAARDPGLLLDIGGG